jgi:hypothetical protein
MSLLAIRKIILAMSAVETCQAYGPYIRRENEAGLRGGA